MIVALKNNKIIGIDKELLDLLNTNLENFSQKINIINLVCASIQENSLIEIENKHFKVKEIEFINFENIKIYNLEESEKAPEISLESELIQPEKAPEISLESELIQPEKAPEISLESELIQPEKAPEISLESELIQPEKAPEISLESELIQPEKAPEPITLSFEDEFEEIDKLLELNSKEIKAKIKEDLEKAAKELNIDQETINELFYELLNQIKEQQPEFLKAIQNKDYDQLHKIAHSLKGASLNLRLANLGLILKYIDERSKARVPISQIEIIVNKFYNFADKILNNQENEIPNESQNPQLDENLKNLIIQTINNYLETNNEKKFKKDLKYIKKLLKLDINSLEDLQNIIKGEQ